jgi:hypothetical protein
VVKPTVVKIVITVLIAASLTGCAARSGPRVVGDKFEGRIESESDWSRVSRLQPAAEITVTLRGVPAVPTVHAARRYFVTADDSTLVVLNLTAATLPSSAVHTLRDMAAQHPDHVLAAQQTGAFRQNNVRVGRDGVFVSDRRIAKLDEIVESVPRDRVTQILGPVVARGSTAGTLIGGWLGFAVGAVPALGGAPAVVGWLVALGSTATGGHIGFNSSSHETVGLVYRAP